MWDSILTRLIYNYALSAHSEVSNVFKSFGAMVCSITNLVVDGPDLKLLVPVYLKFTDTFL